MNAYEHIPIDLWGVSTAVGNVEFRRHFPAASTSFLQLSWILEAIAGIVSFSAVKLKMIKTL